MDRREAAQVIELRQHLWPHTPKSEDPIGEVNTWALLLEPYSVEQVVGAMRSLRRREFAPTIGQIEEAIDPQPDAAAILAEFARMHNSGYSPLWGGQEPPWSHPVIAAAADAGLWRAWAMSPDPEYDEFAQANRLNWIRHEFTPAANNVITRYRREQLRLETGPVTPVIEEASG